MSAHARDKPQKSDQYEMGSFLSTVVSFVLSVLHSQLIVRIFPLGLRLLERGLVPDAVTRWAIVWLLRDRAQSHGVEADQSREEAFIEELRAYPTIAVDTHKV